MSQSIPSNPVRQSHHILIVDDSARLRYALADLVVAACMSSGKPYRLFHSDKDGRFIQSNETINPGMMPEASQIKPSDPNKLDEFAIYTAPSPKQALFVINSPLFTRLTIISDVMMPADTEVGLVGMLEALARRNLPVNLVFASSDAQNRYVVAKLVENNKAYFVVKAGGVWEELSQALVHRTESFQYKQITTADFAGIKGITSHAMGATTGPVPGEQPQHQAPRTAPVAPPPPPMPDFAPAHSQRNAPVAPQRSVPSSPAQRNAVAPATAVAAPVPEQPKAKSGFAPFRPFLALFRALRGR